MNINWHLYSYVRIVFMFILGIVFADMLKWDAVNYFYFSSFTFFVFLSGVYTVAKPARGAYISGLVLLSFFFLGMIKYGINDPRLSNDHFTHFKEYTSIAGTVIEYPKTRTRSKTILRVSLVCNRDVCYKASGDLLLYFPKGDTTAMKLEPGGQIVCTGIYTEVEDSGNPNTFDFKSYLFYRKIHHQILLKSIDNYMVVGSDDLPILYLLAHKSRAALLKVLQQYVVEEDRYAVAAAMMLGYRNQLDNDLYQKFTNSGAVHVLAVSGLHVGIVCSLFYFVLTFWPEKNNKVKVWKFMILSLVVWSYAIMSGAAPAVLRASTMFTILLIGKFWFDFFKTYNIMAFSALIMLIIDPYLLYQASFQFSYISLGSIIFFQPIIGKLYEPKSPIKKFLWQMTNVAIAAQILVFPITIYFFHKFPAYFMLTGIFAVPAAVVILYLGLALMLLHFIAYPIALFVGLLLNLMLNAFIGIIYYIDALPLSSIDGIWISLFEMAMLYCVLFGIMVYLYFKNKKQLYFLGIATTFLISSIWIHHLQAVKSSSIVVYDSYKGSLIDIRSGKNTYTYQSQNLSQQDIVYIAKNYRDYNMQEFIFPLFKIQNYSSDIKTVQNAIQFRNKKIILANNKEDYIDEDMDYLILYNKSKLKPDDIGAISNGVCVILDSTIDKFTKALWEEYCSHNDNIFHSSKGKAIVIDL